MTPLPTVAELWQLKRDIRDLVVKTDRLRLAGTEDYPSLHEKLLDTSEFLHAASASLTNAIVRRESL